MHKSISAWAFSPDRTSREVFEIARRSGFSHVEVAIGEAGSPLAHQLTPASTAADCARLRAEASEAGISLAGLANPLGWDYPLTARDPLVRSQGLELHRQALRLGAELGVDAMLTIVGGVWASFIPGFPVTPYEAAYRNALDSLRALAPLAEEVGVTVAVENVWNGFLLSPLEFRALLDEVGSDRVGAYFDVGNVLLTGVPEQWISILRSRIARVHFKDFRREVGTIAGFCALGEGDADYSAVVAALHEVGYGGPVTAEFFNCEADLPAISRAMDAILGGGR